MKKKRSLLLLFFSASLPWSPLALSTDKSHSFSAASIQLSTLSATRTEHALANLTEPHVVNAKSTASSQTVIDTPVIDTQTVDTEQSNIESATGEELKAEGKATEKLAAEKQSEKYFSDEELAHLRKLFLQAEEAVKKNNEADYTRLAAQLEDYPLHTYLQYQWLKKNLDRADEVKDFIQHNSESRFTSPLKRKWQSYSYS